MTDITKTWQLYSDHEPPKHIDIPLPYLPQGGFVAPLGVQRYIREDLVRGDANEPLADGQWRWMRLAGGTWDVFMIVEGEDDCGNTEFTLLDTCEGNWTIYEISKIGPVIRPPEDDGND